MQEVVPECPKSPKLLPNPLQAFDTLLSIQEADLSGKKAIVTGGRLWDKAGRDLLRGRFCCVQYEWPVSGTHHSPHEIGVRSPLPKRPFERGIPSAQTR